jgi:signal transduction histidine kinase
VTSVERAVTIEADRQSLAAALSNMLQNAFKFSRAQGHVSLTTRATADRVLFEVEDECGGLPPGKPEDLFRAFEQRGPDRSGAGLGLAICLKAAKANGGQMRVRDLPGKGCIFTLDLPRKPPPLEIVGGRTGEKNSQGVAHRADAQRTAKTSGGAK